VRVEKLEYSRRASREVAEIDLVAPEPAKNPNLFEEELSQAEEHLLRAPLGVEVLAVRNGVELRRHVLPGSRHHVYDHYEPSTKTVHIVAVRGAIKDKDPALDE
jgi:hypothetical protein